MISSKLKKLKEMKFIKSIGLLTLFALLALSSCRKDKITEDDQIINPEPAVFFNGSISGVIVDESEEGVPNAEVTFGTNSMTTDENGYFLFKNVSINEKGSLVTAEKEGYFYNAKFVGSRLNKTNYTKIKMIEKVLSGSFEATLGGAVSTNGGANVQFNNNSIKTEGGGLYAGTVNVYATWLDPTANDLGQRAPGDLRAMNTADEQVQLTTYGMIGVELEGESGEALNLADGQTATIELPVPSELLADAPATIPLWHFDESNGYWIEDGEATLQGNKYVGTVSHFSFWNCDDPNYYVYIDGLITDEGGVGIQNLSVQILVNSNGAAGYDFTDQDGVYEGWVPKDLDLTIKVFDNCGNEIYSAAIGPFATDESIPEFSIVGTSSTFITLSGILECNGTLVTDGYAKITHGTSYSILSVDASGAFNGTIDVCGETAIDVIAYDLVGTGNGPQQSVPSTHDISGLSELNLGSITVCENATEHLTFEIDGVSFTSLEPFAFSDPVEGLSISMPEDSFQLANFSLNVLTETTGSNFTPTSMGISVPDSGNQILAWCQDCTGVEVDITTFEEVGGLIIGEFEGTIEAQQGQPEHEVSGSFKVIRDE